jgi:hypothetical protein
MTTLFYLDTTDAHSLRCHETLGAFFGIAFLTRDEAASAQASLDDCDDLEIVEADVRDLPPDVSIPVAGVAIVAGDEGPIYGVAESVDEAYGEFVAHYDNTRQAPEVVGWQYRDAADTVLVYSVPCSRDLIDAVGERGGGVSFEIIGRGRRAVAVLA